MTTLMEYLLACNILDIVTGFLKAYDQKIFQVVKLSTAHYQKFLSGVLLLFQ